MGLKITPTLLSFQNDNAFEDEIRAAVTDICDDMKPSRNALNTILQFAASYECVKTKAGRFDLILN
ncbi:MAG: hypothetical protein MJZ47_00435 [Bacteroidales bacterium]|nr:hypothetical protein [Bacteroidales bacterium]